MRNCIRILLGILIVGTLEAQTFSEVAIAALPDLTNVSSVWADLDNDGNLDLLVAGELSTGADYFNVFYNNGDDTFTASSAGITTLEGMRFAVGEINNDGFADLLVSGEDASGNASTATYINNQDKTFTNTDLGIKDLQDGDVSFGDFDNDGDSDILYNGKDDTNTRFTQLYKNIESTFQLVSTNLIDLSNGRIAISDFDKDGDIDVFLTGVSNSSVSISRLYENKGELVFDNTSNSFTGIAFNDITINDFDLNGFQDIAVTGIAVSGFVSEYYTNNNGVFSNVNIGLTPLGTSQVTSADFNGDVYPDIIIGGITGGGIFESFYFRSDGSGGFDDYPSPLNEITNGVFSSGDYNNDGYTDIFYAGSTEVSLLSKLFENDTTYAVSVVTTPLNPLANTEEGNVTLQWDAVANAPSYNIYLKNNTLDSVLVAPVSDLTTGFNRTASHGQFNKNQFQFKSLPEGNYEWQVQTINTNFKGSAFTAIENFQVCYSFSLGADTATCFNETFTLSAGTSADVVNWYSKENGLLLANSNEYVFPAQVKDTLIAEVNKPFGCIARDTIIADVIDLPVFNIGTDTAICFNESITIEVPGFGTAEIDSVNWYSKVSGAQLIANSANYTFSVSSKDTLIAEVFNVSRCVNYDSIIVDVVDLPVFNVGADTAICFNESFTVEVPGFGTAEIDSVNWYSKVSGVQLIANSANYTYSVSSKDTLIAEVFNVSRCVNYDSIIVNVIDLPVFNVGADTAICFNESITIEVPGFGTAEIDSVNWYSKVSGMQLIANSANYTYSVTSKDTLIAEVFNVSRCVNYDSIIVDVIDLPVFSVGTDNAICFNESITIEVPGFGTAEIDSVNWYSKVSGMQLIANSATYTYSVTSKDTLIAEVFNVSRCVNYDSIIVDVIDLPVFSVGADTAICFNESLTVEVPGFGTAEIDSVNWYSKVSGMQLIANSANYTYSVNSKDTLIAEVFNASRCVNYDSIIVDVIDLPVFNIGADTAICFNESITVEVPGFGTAEIDSVNWYSKVSGMQLIANSSNYTYSVTSKDTLIAEVFNVSRCVNYDSIIVDVIDLPVFNVGADTAICFNESLTVEVPGFGTAEIDSVNWYSKVSGMQLIANSANFTYSVISKDTLIAEVFNVSRCVNYDSIIVDVIDLPVFNIGADTAICFNESITIEVPGFGTAGIDSVNWYSKVSGMQLKANSATYTYSVTSKDTLIAEVFNVSRCVNYDSIIVDVIDLPVFNIGADTAICFNESITVEVPGFGTAGIDSVNWYSKVSGMQLIANSANYTYSVTSKDTLIAEVFNISRCVNYDSIIVDVIALPVFDLGADKSECVNEVVLLQTLPSFKETNWRLINGTTLQENSFFYSHKVVTSDTIVAEFFNENGCVNYDTIIIKADPLPVISLGEDLEICAGDTIRFNFPDFQKVEWFTQNEGLVASNSIFKMPFLNSDQLWIKVTNETQCVAYDTIQVTVNQLPILSLPGDTTLCIGADLSLDAGGDFAVYNWVSDKEGFLANGRTLVKPVSQDERLILTVTDAKGCVMHDTTFLKASPLPDFTIEEDRSLCAGEIAVLEVSGTLDSINWISGNTGLIASGDFSVEYLTDKTDAITAIGYTAFGCEVTKEFTLTINELPVVNAGEDVLSCKENDILLGAAENDPTYSYQWSPATYLNDATISRPVANPLENITYIVTVTDANGCIGKDTVVVEVNPVNTINVGGNEEICIGESIKLGGVPTASGSSFDYRYEWTPANSIDDPTLANPMARPTETTEYRLLVFTADCKIDTAFTTITVNPLPVITILADTTIGAGEPLELFASGGTDYLWSPEIRLDDPAKANPLLTDLQNDVTYEVNVTDENGCEDQGVVRIFVRNELFIPTLFTPNEDGANDLFLLYADGIEKITFKIYDIGGNLIYETDDPIAAQEKGWDGTVNGEKAPDGSYIWTINGKFFNGEPVEFNGTTKGVIRLVR